MPRGMLLPLGLVLTAVLPGQQLPIRTYTVADGLAEDRVNRIVADSRGYVWIATAGGLSRFDGYRMKTYGVEDGLPFRTVNTLLETPSGAYLIGGSIGLCRLEKRGAQPFTAYRLEKQTAGVETFLMQPSGRVLVGSRNGLFEVDSGMSFHRLPVNEPVGTRIVALASDHVGNLWISSERALGILAPGGELAIFLPGRDLPAAVHHAEAMMEQPPGRMWAATNAGLVLFDRPDGGKWRFNRIFTKADGLAGIDVLAIERDSVGRLWLGTSEGISRFSPQAPLPPHFENLGKAQGLSGRRITALARDPTGNMWAGTESAGVMRIAREGFLAYREEDGLDAERIFEVLESRAGEILAVAQRGASRRSIGIFDGGRFRSFIPPAIGDGWGTQQILLQARSGEWWAATHKGLLRFPLMKAAGLAAAVRPIRYSQGDIFHLFEDSQGGIWASANNMSGMQLMRWDARSRALAWFCAGGTTALRPCVFDALVTTLAEDSGHNIWMGLWSGGLMRYAAGRFTRFGEAEGLPPGGVRILVADHRGRLWIGGGGGLVLLAEPAAPHPHFDIYNKSRGLSSNSILCIVEDAMGLLYLGTSRGVDRLDPETGHVRHFSSLEGVPYGGFTSAIRDRSGAIWFSSYRGLYRLIPQPPTAPGSLKVLITGLQAGGENTAISQLGESRIAGLRLGPSRNRMQVEFVAPGNEFGEDLRYKFKLAGADTAWTEPRAQHAVDYRNLAAGSYQFLVKAVDPEGHESANPAEVVFTILPPLWQRWWFELCLLLAAIALAYALHAYRLKHIVAMERMRTAIATDLHDDIGASLAQIAVWSEVAQVNGAASEERNIRPMARIANLARELTASMNDIVWSIRSGDESLESLTRRMRQFAAEFLQPADIDFSWKASSPPPRLRLTLNSRRQIFLIYKECMHNILKHARCREAFIRFDVSDREAVTTVADDGGGFDPCPNSGSTTHRAGNGLTNMRRRAQSMGGNVEFGSRPGGGCQITVRLPVRKHAFRDAVL
jgi:ligand-binding sensor domain-containing protein/signal transduction histidine kinase